MNCKKKGNIFETEMAFRLREVFRDARTCNFMGARWLDRCGVDLANTGNFNVQCKHLERTPPYHKILAEMPQTKNINVVLHKKNNEGIVAVLDFEDFLKILKHSLGRLPAK